MQEVLDRAARIRLAAFDVDGVLTDGSLFLSDSGEEFKQFNVHDGLGLVLLRDAGCEVAIISSRESPAVTARMNALGIHHVIQGERDKARALRELASSLGIPMEAAAFVGDDVLDLPAMGIAGLAVAVANAHAAVREAAHWITDLPGGSGAAREVCDLLLRARGGVDETRASLAGS